MHHVLWCACIPRRALVLLQAHRDQGGAPLRASCAMAHAVRAVDHLLLSEEHKSGLVSPDNPETSCPNFAAPTSSDSRFRTLTLHLSLSRTTYGSLEQEPRLLSCQRARRQHSLPTAQLRMALQPTLLACPPALLSPVLESNSTCLLAR
jgi:hypothetical protein